MREVFRIPNYEFTMNDVFILFYFYFLSFFSFFALCFPHSRSISSVIVIINVITITYNFVYISQSINHEYFRQLGPEQKT